MPARLRLRVLFVCAMNKWRSRTAEHIYREDPRLDVRSAGLRSGAVHPLSDADLAWAELVLGMEREHKRELRERCPEWDGRRRVEVLGIPDDYPFMDAELQELLRFTAGPLLDAAVESRPQADPASQDSG